MKDEHRQVIFDCDKFLSTIGSKVTSATTLHNLRQMSCVIMSKKDLLHDLSKYMSTFNGCPNSAVDFDGLSEEIKDRMYIYCHRNCLHCFKKIFYNDDMYETLVRLKCIQEVGTGNNKNTVFKKRSDV